MSANSFGQFFKVSTFGESHGPSMGALIEGCPAGVRFQRGVLEGFLERRRPGQSGVAVSDRQERDQVEIHSGIFEDVTLGTPILAMVRNQDARSGDYEKIQDQPRVGHADDTWNLKFGHSDHRGGGRASGRETLARVIGGAFAQMLLEQVNPEFKILAYPKSIGPIEFFEQDILFGNNNLHLRDECFRNVDSFLSSLKVEGESVGGVIELKIENAKAGLGQPVFKKLKSELAGAIMSIGATCSFEMGDGVQLTKQRGTQIHTEMNNPAYGGVRGGISTGEVITAKVGFKPTSSILDVAKKGRHDPCILIRALPVVEAMGYLVFADHYLWSRLDRIDT